jgi:hypothetical protein
MSNAFDFCIPTRGTRVPYTPEWIYEIKYDSYRLRLERDGVRLFTRNGYDWTKRYPWIVESALKNRQKHFVTLPSRYGGGYGGWQVDSVFAARCAQFQTRMFAGDPC